MLFALIVACMLVVTGCEEILTEIPVVSNRVNVNFYALAQGNVLLRLNALLPERALETIKVNGLQNGESLMAIDFRPASGQLYAVGSTSRLYVIDLKTGLARAIGAGPFTPAINGDLVGFDFNPTVDRIRLTTNNGQNMRLNPETGAVVAVDGTLKPGTPGIVEVAYTNNFAGAGTTTLFDLDGQTNKLMRQNPPNDGGLEAVGELGIDFFGPGGFDISPDGKAALAALWDGESYKLYQIDLATGKATRIGNFGGDYVITGLAIPTQPVAYAVDADNVLHIFNPTKPQPISKNLSGLQSGEFIFGLDMRPANGQLYALGSSSRIYTINTASGAATPVGTAPFAPALNGPFFGFDFNPTVDRIRIVSNMGQNLRVHPETGVVAAVDAELKPSGEEVSAAAYSDNFAGTTSTILYDLGTKADKLFRQSPPNEGQLVEVGPLGVNAEANNGFDIGGTSGKAFAILTVNGKAGIYTIDLGTGKANKVNDFIKNVRGMALGLGF